jgi:hypothetical protein
MNEEYKYKDFDTWFKAILPNLWNVAVWDNETIKAYLEEAFLDAREKVSKKEKFERDIKERFEFGADLSGRNTP